MFYNLHGEVHLGVHFSHFSLDDIYGCPKVFGQITEKFQHGLFF